MSNRNLPPGCTSADGGLDHDYDNALDTLTEACDEPAVLRLFARLAQEIEKYGMERYRDGHDAGRDEVLFERDKG